MTWSASAYNARYGLHSFAHAVVQTFERLALSPLTPALHETISVCSYIAEHLSNMRSGDIAVLFSASVLLTKGAMADNRAR